MCANVCVQALAAVVLVTPSTETTHAHRRAVTA